MLVWQISSLLWRKHFTIVSILKRPNRLMQFWKQCLYCETIALSLLLSSSQSNKGGVVWRESGCSWERRSIHRQCIPPHNLPHNFCAPLHTSISTWVNPSPSVSYADFAVWVAPIFSVHLSVLQVFRPLHSSIMNVCYALHNCSCATFTP